jgi:hypothetical protein
VDTGRPKKIMLKQWGKAGRRFEESHPAPGLVRVPDWRRLGLMMLDLF